MKRQSMEIDCLFLVSLIGHSLFKHSKAGFLFTLSLLAQYYALFITSCSLLA